LACIEQSEIVVGTRGYKLSPIAHDKIGKNMIRGATEMSQGRPSTFSSQIRNGGRALLYAHPLTGARTFKPSGNPKTDPQETVKETDLEIVRRKLGIETREGRDAWDAEIKKINPTRAGQRKQYYAYWDRIRFQTNNSPRSRKRALEREARREREMRERKPR
jgi:hypothetical protein